MEQVPSEGFLVLFEARRRRSASSHQERSSGRSPCRLAPAGLPAGSRSRSHNRSCDHQPCSLSPARWQRRRVRRRNSLATPRRTPAPGPSIEIAHTWFPAPLSTEQCAPRRPAATRIRWPIIIASLSRSSMMLLAYTTQIGASVLQDANDRSWRIADIGRCIRTTERGQASAFDPRWTIALRRAIGGCPAPATTCRRNSRWGSILRRRSRIAEPSPGSSAPLLG